ncbi:Uncharacterised protein [Listeria grayi]|uniref:Uncharacterized protein n=1 Tax=Listeria grayi TaxID=1641 RepID=A0A378MHS8_LISGR|nr:Uncharacterised protein [Listeria grayi]
MIKTGKFFLIVTLVLAITIGNSVHAKAEEPQSLMLYNKGVKDDIINSKKYDYAKWKASILSLLKVLMMKLEKHMTTTIALVNGLRIIITESFR